MPRARYREEGIALLVVTGILVLLSLAATALLSLTSQLRSHGSARLDQTTARLLARSGIEYASARLYQDSSPRTPPTPGNQSDDWTFRDDPGTPLEKSRNPSYAMTEPYLELGNNGRYDEGADSLPPGSDWNGNGRFDAWSGRLRGRYGMTSGTFSLKVAAEGGKLNINAGMLDTRRMNIDMQFPDCQCIDPRFDPQSGLPFEPAIKNVRIADTINLLGQVLLGAVTLDAKAPLLGAGNIILRNRMQGGYRSLEQVRPLFSSSDWGRISGYLGVAGDQSGRAATRFYRNPAEDVAPYGTSFPFYDQWPQLWFPPSLRTAYLPTHIPPWAYHSAEQVPAVNLAAADRSLLQALFLGLTGYPYHALEAGAAPTASLLNAKMGFLDAGRVADFLIANRPFASRLDLFRKLDAAKGFLFPEDIPNNQNVKVNLVADNADDDPDLIPGQEFMDWGGRGFPISADFPAFSWATYDIRRQEGVIAPIELSFGLASQTSHFTLQRREDRVERTAVDWREAELPIPASGLDRRWGNTQRRFGTLPLALEPSGLFAVESLAFLNRPSGHSFPCTFMATLRITDLIAARSQADFENVEGSRRLRGGAFQIGRPLVKDRMQTYPRFPLDSCRDLDRYPRGELYPNDPSYEYPTAYRFPDDFGTIALMSYTGYAAEAVNGQFLYQPCWEDGQPLRRITAPSLPAEAESNFQDAVGANSFAHFEASPSGTLDATSGVSVAPLPVEILFPFEPELQAILTPYHVCTPVCTPDTRFFRWNAGEFPWYGAKSGAFEGGSISFWAITAYINMSNQDLSLRFGILDDNLAWGKASLVFFKGGRTYPAGKEAGTYQETDIQSIRFYAPQTWHHVVFAFDGEAESLKGYVDGIQDPGLSDDADTYAGNPFYEAKLTTLRYPTNEDTLRVRISNRRSQMRLFAGPPLSQRQVNALSQQPFYWHSYADDRVEGIPSYVSPLYRFPTPVQFASARWDGFVPNLVADAVRAAGAQGPLRVELLCFDKPDGTDPARVVKLPGVFWETGGGHHDFQMRCSSFRYRVWMDISAVDGFSNETPVFDGISVSFRSPRLQTWEAR